ncbi:lysine N(6)-hydroxylase/L-ornithine N(5)-oxygenase family protein [Flavivirga jejuensis]|uniref:SidA/IucD/PvdA family monooxygenase n=1 Tax=Flavivirga jejuensis TaxID=870487 RepID=A0ABT8WT49_9FLAO|nr:SidA/IucD/PvdA family monooxygenase [Flavivirga jejuensis]MDO5976363.1 SidA/IucD/PvdA family monooxygenase [Flavivirga jejuensis]
MDNLKKQKHKSLFDSIGIGVGPANLSLSALLSPIQGFKSLFLDKQTSFIWHEGMLMSGVTLQVSFLKDLVTLVDPTNPFSFLNFLSENKRLYRFSISGIDDIKRTEFNQYYNWVIQKMNNLEFGNEVISACFMKDYFVVKTKTQTYRSKNIVIGTGLIPFVPEVFQKYIGDTLFHSSVFMKKNTQFSNKRVAVIGGGQSGAEIINNLISLDSKNSPKRIDWISQRYNFLPMDDSPFTNELYTPSYSEYFFKLPKNVKLKLIENQKLTSDGISEDLLKSIYSKLYEKEVLVGNKICDFHPSCQLEDIYKNGSSYKLVINKMLPPKIKVLDVDIVILATGYKEKLPKFIESIEGDFRENDQLVEMNEDFSVPWNGPKNNKIYVQNGARKIWGVPNPNLSLNSWRAAKIVNSLLQEEYYCLKGESSTFEWDSEINAPNNKLDKINIS